MKKIELSIFCFFVILALGLICAKIGVDTLFTASGAEYSQIQSVTQKLQTENIILKEKILTKSSYYYIASEAATMGFVPVDAKTSIVLANPVEPFAYNQ